MSLYSTISVEEVEADGGAPMVSPAVKRTPRNRLARVGMALILAVSVAAPTAYLIRGTGIKTTLLSVVPGYSVLKHPSVTLSRPGPTDGIISCDTFISVDVALPNAGHAIDPATVHAGSVRLINKGDNSIVPARVNTSAAGDAIVLQPEEPLIPNTFYRFEILPALKDTGGASFQGYTVGFTTGGSGNAVSMPLAFEKVALPTTAGHAFTGVTVGPDNKLYACTYTGEIHRYDLSDDGTIVGQAVVINAVQTANGGPRLITGICFDPDSTAEQPVLYVSHGQCTRTSADEWTGKLSRLTGSDLSHYQDVVVGFPRASRDHLNNQMSFGPDGALYLPNGSNSSMGAADPTWHMRPERQLSACVMRIDLAMIGQHTLDIRTQDGGGNYDPFAAHAPVTVYASGVRNAYDLAWTRSGKLFAPINGSAAGGNTPASPKGDTPALADLRLTIPDHLALIERAGYYGHPNPSRGEYALMGGNPTEGIDPIEVTRYPVGTQPNPNWKPPIAEFGSNLAPCGIIEFQGKGPTAMLDGALMVCRFSGGKDICLFLPNADGSMKEMITGIDGLTRFADPLDLAQHPQTGNLYVAEFGGKQLTLVRAKPNGTSTRVHRQEVGKNLGLVEPRGHQILPRPDGEVHSD